LLSILEQNPGTSWEVLLSSCQVQKSQDSVEISPPDEKRSEKPPEPKSADDLVSFKL
jgi:hypothetical protein